MFQGIKVWRALYLILLLPFRVLIPGAFMHSASG